ncbi:MAG: hypothetical protein ACKV2T_32855 [Kofleriaceae bacterium]
MMEAWSDHGIDSEQGVAQNPAVRIALSIVVALHVGVAIAAPCHVGDVSAAEDRDLGVLDGVTCLDGSLHITGTITNLRSLKALTEIKGDVHVARAERLSTLRGLDAVVRVGGSIHIGGPKQGVPRLRNIDGLRGVTEVGRDLWISGGYIFKPGKSRMSFIDGVDGLTSLVRVGGDVVLFDVRAFRGLDALREIGGDLRIEHSDFAKLAGFAKLEKIGGSVLFDNNQWLTQMPGAPKLAKVGGDVSVGCHNEDDPTRSLRLTEKTVRARFQNVAVGGVLWRIATTPCWFDPRVK